MAKKIEQFLQKRTSPLASIYHKVDELNHLNKIFHAIYNNDLGKQCYVVDLTAKTLHLIVTTSAWATKLRFSIPDIIKILKTQPEFNNICKIKYKIDNFKAKAPD
ncbi:MAG: DUF721 domain-containing protein [Gammaproteobacteria bacterium]|nr:DUF721 domain-containing protein [Gammaproteobacteria bacterium]